MLACLCVGVFLLVRLLPGDPARSVAGMTSNEKAVEALREQMGLDDPIWLQFVHFVTGIFKGNLGTSFETGEPVIDVLTARLEPTLQLAGSAMVLIILIGLPLGILGAVVSSRGARTAEILFSGFTGVISSIPQYLLATFLAFAFAVKLRWLPVAGAESWQALILPSIAIATRPAMVIARILRVRTLEVLELPYMRAARSKRLPKLVLYLKHLLPNSVTTTVAMGGVVFAGLLGGAVVIEAVFSRPGLGASLVQAVLIGDYPMIQGIVLLFGFFVVLANTVADLILGWVDPRVRGL